MSASVRAGLALASALLALACTPSLHELIERGRTPEALERIRAGEELRAVRGALQPIHAAARLGRVDVLEALLHAGVDVDARTGEAGRTPLVYAALAGRLDAVELLVARGADVNHRPRDGVRALHAAAEFNHTDVAAALLAAGAEVDARSAEGATALHHACGNRGDPDAQLATVALLLDHGADLDAARADGWGVREAARQGHNRTLRALLAAVRPGSAQPDTAAFEPERVIVEIERAVASDAHPGLARVTGRAAAVGAGAGRLDLVLAIDASDSTAGDAGFDVDGDGAVREPGLAEKLGLGRSYDTHPGDDVLAAELAAAESLLAGLAPGARVAIVAFAGAPAVPEVEVALSLTADRAKWRAALAGLREARLGGRTHLAQALQASVAELERAGRPERDRVIVLMSDGEPTAPFESSRAANLRLALQVAELAPAYDLRIDTLAFGEPGERRDALEAVADAGGGTHARVASAQDYPTSLESAASVRAERVDIRNDGTGEAAVAALLQPGGRFAALVPFASGAGRVRVTASARGAAPSTATARVVPGAELDARERLELSLLRRGRRQGSAPP